MLQDAQLAAAIATAIGFAARASGIILWELFLGSILFTLLTKAFYRSAEDQSALVKTVAVMAVVGLLALLTFARYGTVAWGPLVVGNLVLLAGWGVAEMLQIGIVRQRNAQNWHWISVVTGVVLMAVALTMMVKANGASQEMPRHIFIGTGFLCFFTGILLVGLSYQEIKLFFRRTRKVG